MTLWLIRAKRGEHERQFFQESRIYLMVAQQLNAARRLRVFEQDMRVNDWVVVPRHISQSVAIGVVRGEYEYHSCQNELFRYSRVVEWVEAELPLSVIDEDLIASFRSAPTCSRIRQPLAEERIRSLIAEHSIKTSATRRSYPNGSSWRVADQSKPEQKTGSSFLRRKLRERDILDYLALTSTCFTLAKLIASIWKDTDGKSTAGYIILLAELGLLAFLELRAGTGNFLTLPNSVTVPLILTSFGVTVLISTPGKLFLTLIATT
ncbi:MAG: hypothetical protein ACRD72_18000, partial [Candidatus Angelobacter sp.]